MTNILIGLVIGAIAGFGLAFINWQQNGKPKRDAELALLESELNEKRREAEREAEQLVTNAERKADKAAQEAERQAVKLVQDAERQAEKKFADVAREEGRIDGLRTEQEKQLSSIDKAHAKLNRRQSNIDKRESELQKAEEEQKEKLEQVASLTQEEAKQQLLDAVEADARQDMARIMREIDEQARETAEEQARRHIATAIQRIGSGEVHDTTVSTVVIPDEAMKGRIIGRNGRNIRAFEQAAGVDIVVDDTPETVAISSFDPVRREVARRALEKLILDGRIHPGNIEKLVRKSEKEVDTIVKEAGESAAYEASVHGLHPEIIKTLGRLKFRTSYGQNQLHHAVEASKLAALLAAEIGADIDLAKMGGLLHDLGKAIDHNQEGTHALLGAELAKRFKVPPKVVNAIASHHHEVEQETVEAILVEAADAISGARPGARRESLEFYIKRVRTLEEIALSFEGVDSAFALQAGREIRVMVQPEQIDDYGAMKLSKDIAKTIEDNMQYPGQIQVTVLRETRAIGTAK